MGTERRSMVISDEEKRTTAVHEAGPHAHQRPHRPPRSGPQGHHHPARPARSASPGTCPKDDRHNLSKEQAESSIAVALGGRIAEEIIFGQMTTGAGNDIEKATEIARKMVCEWGMSEKLGPLAYGKKEESIFLGRDYGQRTQDYSEQTAQEIDQEVRGIVQRQYVRVKDLLTREREKLERLADVAHRARDARRRGDRRRPRGARAPEARQGRHPDLRREGQGREGEAPRREHLRRPAEAGDQRQLRERRPRRGERGDGESIPRLPVFVPCFPVTPVIGATTPPCPTPSSRLPSRTPRRGSPHAHEDRHQRLRPHRSLHRPRDGRAKRQGPRARRHQRPDRREDPRPPLQLRQRPRPRGAPRQGARGRHRLRRVQAEGHRREGPGQAPLEGARASTSSSSARASSPTRRRPRRTSPRARRRSSSAPRRRTTT